MEIEEYRIETRERWKIGNRWGEDEGEIVLSIMDKNSDCEVFDDVVLNKEEAIELMNKLKVFIEECDS